MPEPDPAANGHSEFAPPAHPAPAAESALAATPSLTVGPHIPDQPPAAAPPPRCGKRPDRWAHRRGEPRVFAFLWTVFLLAVTTLGFLSVGFGGPVTLDIYRPAARILLVTAAIGITVLWPMTRLAQALPPRGDAPAAVLKDLGVLLLPAQAVVWPQVWLAAWPRGTIAMIDGVLVAWGLLTAGWLAVAMQWTAAREAGPSPAVSGARTAWTAAGVALVLAAPAAMALSPGRSGTTAAMLSPITAIFELTQDRAWTGAGGGVNATHLWTTAGIATAGIALLLVAAVGVVGGGRGRER